MTVYRPKIGPAPRHGVRGVGVSHGTVNSLPQYAARFDGAEIEAPLLERDDFSDAIVVFGPYPDLEVGSQRLSDFSADESLKCLAADAPHNLSDQMSHVGGVIPGGGTRLPPRRLGRQ